MPRTWKPSVLPIGLWILLSGVGCGATPRETIDSPEKDDPAVVPMRSPQDPKSNLPRPDPSRIQYDQNSRVLTLYELPDRESRWMMTSPTLRGEPVNIVHSFTDDVDLNHTRIFYTTAGGQASPRITLSDILLAQQQARIQ